MSDLTESPNEKHNRIAMEIAERIMVDFPDLISRMVIMESLVSGLIGIITKDVAIRKKLFNVLSEGIIERLEKP
jgi:hypothetical protein